MTERCNIQYTFVSSYNAINYDMREGNADTQAFLDRYPNLRGYIAIDPRDLAGSVEQMERYFQDPRFVGVKLYCPFGGNMATKRMQDLLDEIAKFGRPTKIHMDELPNVYFEFCSSGINAGVIRRSMDILGPERILFGTDQPLFTPWFEYGAYADAIETQREADLIFRENARRIFRLD